MTIVRNFWETDPREREHEELAVRYGRKNMVLGSDRPDLKPLSKYGN